MSGGGKPQMGRMTLGANAPRGVVTDTRTTEAELREIDKQADLLSQVRDAQMFTDIRSC